MAESKKPTAAGKKAAARSGTSPAEKKSAASDAASATTGNGSASSTSATEFVVLDNEDPWTEAELSEQRSVLESESHRLRREITDSEAEMADLVQSDSDTAGDDQADTGSKTFEREHEMHLTSSHRDMLSQTDRALSRIENGTYGQCENCGNPIGKARLQAFPRATLCMTCKQREERR